MNPNTYTRTLAATSVAGPLVWSQNECGYMVAEHEGVTYTIAYVSVCYWDLKIRRDRGAGTQIYDVTSGGYPHGTGHFLVDTAQAFAVLYDGRKDIRTLYSPAIDVALAAKAAGAVAR